MLSANTILPLIYSRPPPPPISWFSIIVRSRTRVASGTINHAKLFAEFFSPPLVGFDQHPGHGINGNNLNRLRALHFSSFLSIKLASLQIPCTRACSNIVSAHESFRCVPHNSSRGNMLNAESRHGSENKTSARVSCNTFQLFLIPPPTPFCISSDETRSLALHLIEIQA